MATPSTTDENSQEPSTIKTENEMGSVIFSYRDGRGQLSYLDQDVEEIPQSLIAEYAEKAVILDLSLNRIRSLRGLEKFVHLEELILDNNELGDDVRFPCLPSLNTLFINKNKFTEIESLLQKIKESFPEIRYLSLLGNAACPNELSSTEKDEEDYQRYRYLVLFRLSNLKFLDSREVTHNEQMEAERRGPFMQVVRPDSDTEDESSATIAEPSPLPTDPRGESEDTHLGRWGRSRSRYLGRNSEGNRFITDVAL